MKQPTGFLGTYFERDSVLKLATLATFFSWIVVIVYGSQLLLSIIVFTLQYIRGFVYIAGPTDLAQQILFLLETPFRGVVYFVALQAIAKVLQIFLDVEDNTRRAARADHKEN
jgi:hypothetical protein